MKINGPKDALLRQLETSDDVRYVACALEFYKLL
jgi:hypothetical protein